MRGRSTCTNLLERLNDVTCKTCQTAIIYAEFSTVFDVVAHDKLFAKLHAYHIRGVLLQWIKNLFCGRIFAQKLTIYCQKWPKYLRHPNSRACFSTERIINILLSG